MPAVYGAITPISMMPAAPASILASQGLSCAQFLSLSPSDAYFRTGSAYPSVVAYCRGTLAYPAAGAINPAGQAESGVSWKTVAVTIAFVGLLGFFAYSNEEERKANKAKYFKEGRWT